MYAFFVFADYTSIFIFWISRGLLSRYHLVIDTYSDRNAVLDGFSKMIAVSMSLGNANFNVISIPAKAKLLDNKGRYGHTLEFTAKSGETVIVERVNRCGLGRGRRSGCIPYTVKYGDTINIRYSPKNFKNVRIETFGAYWNWFGNLIIATIPPLGYRFARWQQGY